LKPRQTGLQDAINVGYPQFIQNVCNAQLTNVFLPNPEKRDGNKMKTAGSSSVTMKKVSLNNKTKPTKN